MAFEATLYWRTVLWIPRGEMVASIMTSMPLIMLSITVVILMSYPEAKYMANEKPNTVL